MTGNRYVLAVFAIVGVGALFYYLSILQEKERPVSSKGQGSGGFTGRLESGPVNVETNLQTLTDNPNDLKMAATEGWRLAEGDPKRGWEEIRKLPPGKVKTTAQLNFFLSLSESDPELLLRILCAEYKELEPRALFAGILKLQENKSHLFKGLGNK